jgi:hypothetical protein
MTLLQSARRIDLRTNFKEDKELVEKILDLTHASYVTNTELIEREIEHNSDIYIITDDRGGLSAFFMVNFEPVNGEETYYLGLSACRDELKGQGLGKSLYLRFMDDCRSRERREQKKFLLWWTTATPIVYYWFNKYVAKVQPDMNGDYDEFGAATAHAIRREKFPAIAKDPHPFILRSVAENTTYSLTEQARLLVATETLGMDVFQKFNLKEENADRFLMIGYAPE